MTVPLDLDGAVAVLTGAGSGVGRATALSLAGRGTRVAVSDLDGDRAQETASLVAADGGEAIGVPVDVANQDDLEELRDRCLERFGRVDVVVNNVGVLAMGAPESLPLEAWRRVLDLEHAERRPQQPGLPSAAARAETRSRREHGIGARARRQRVRPPALRCQQARNARSLRGARDLPRPHLIGVTCVCPSRVATNIVEQITTYGQPPPPRPLQHPIVEPVAVGELIVDAITAGTFFVVTAPEVHDELRERASDPEAYVQRLIREQQP